MSNDNEQPTVATQPQPNQDQVSVSQFEKELSDLLAKYHIRIQSEVDFPIYKELPEEVRLAMIIIHKHGGVIKPNYILEK